MTKFLVNPGNLHFFPENFKILEEASFYYHTHYTILDFGITLLLQCSYYGKLYLLVYFSYF